MIKLINSERLAMGEILNDWTYRQAKANLRAVEDAGEAAELASAIAGYESLRTSGQMSLELGSLQEIGCALIKARITRGWTQEQLARRLSMPKQQVQRYEATEYSSASLRRVAEVADVLDFGFSANMRSSSGFELGSELARSLAGYSAVEAVQDIEKRIRLRRMTADEARRIFDNLCDTYYQLEPLHQHSTAEDLKGLSHRLAIRKAFETLARKGGNG
jgi:transcriptional regulator with XRE-family HTH domain